MLPVQAKKSDKTGQPAEPRLDPCGTDEIKCRNLKGEQLLPYPENCTQYLRCMPTRDRPQLEDCPSGQSFDNVSLSCTKQDYQCQSPCPEGAYVRALLPSDVSPMSSAVDNVTRQTSDGDALTTSQPQRGRLWSTVPVNTSLRSTTDRQQTKSTDMTGTLPSVAYSYLPRVFTLCVALYRVGQKVSLIIIAIVSRDKYYNALDGGCRCQIYLQIYFYLF